MHEHNSGSEHHSSGNGKDLMANGQANLLLQENSLVEMLDQLTAGNYMVEADQSTAIGQALQRLITKLRTTNVDELDRVVQLSMCSNETSISSAKLLYNLQSVDEKAQTIATSAEELQASVAQIREYSQSIRSENSDSVKTMDEVAQSLKVSISAFDRIRTSVEDNADKVGEMGSFASEIRDIADEIKGIAFQTNLLALNASVEAAKAGRVGAGFAVVAQEMRSLANRSSEATSQIRSLVDNFEE